MVFNQKGLYRAGWRSFAAVTLFIAAFVCLLLGVSLSERTGMVESDILTKAYYSVGLFVMGGLDFGTPQGGPVFARYLLWFCYFAAPFVAASALFEALFHALAPKHWQLTHIKNHIIIV